MTTQTPDVDTKLLPLRWVTAAMTGIFMALFAFFPWLRDDSDWVSGVGRESAHDLTGSDFPTTTIGYFTLTVGLTIATFAILHMCGRVTGFLASNVAMYGGMAAFITTLCLSVDEDWKRGIGFGFTIAISTVGTVVGAVGLAISHKESQPRPKAESVPDGAPTED